MADNIFLKPVEFYQRRINPLGQYVEQNAYYLSKMTGKPFDNCYKFVASKVRRKDHPGMVDPIVDHFERNEYGDREKFQTPLSEYLNQTVKAKQILVPTFTTYVHPDEERSILADFIGGNKKIRSVAKHEAAEAEVAGNIPLYIFKNNEQANMKTYNNSMSGAFAAEGSVLKNPTGHNTLTSITRSMTSVGNALNERIIAGSRHYRSPDITMYNLISSGTTMDRPLVQQCMETFQLYYPTVQDCMDVIQWSTDFYWKDDKAMSNLRVFVMKLDPLERAAFVYGQDLYHIRKYNPEFIKTFLERLAKKEIIQEYEDPIKVIYSVDEMILNYAQQVCIAEVKGKGKKYAEMPNKNVQTVANVCINIEKTVLDYKLLIDSLFLTRMVPPGTAYISNMVRRSVVLSDTDSTMFSIDEWVGWYFNKLTFTDYAFAISGAVMFFATQCIAHSLAIMSANMGVAKEHIFKLAMKPEFVFPVFAQTAVAKHYFSCILVKEGVVYDELKYEIKGVHLKNSAAPKVLVKDGQEKMKQILRTVMAEKKITILDEIKDVANLERKITSSLFAGDTVFYKKSKVKDPAAYSKGPLQSPYQHHVFWDMVFAPKYANSIPPPYGVIKIPTKLTTPTATKVWVSKLLDRELADRFDKWMLMHNKKKLPTVYINLDYVAAYGIPEELKSLINVKKILLDLTGMNRMILDTLGFPVKSGWLLSEMGY